MQPKPHKNGDFLYITACHVTFRNTPHLLNVYIQKEKKKMKLQNEKAQATRRAHPCTPSNIHILIYTHTSDKYTRVISGAILSHNSGTTPSPQCHNIIRYVNYLA